MTCSCCSTVTGSGSAFLPAVRPHGHLTASPGHPRAAIWPTGLGEGCPPAPAMVTFLLSCWFSFSSSPHLRLLSSSAREASRSPWTVLCRLWFSFSSFRMRLEAHSFSSNTKDFLEAETQSRVRPGLPALHFHHLPPTLRWGRQVPTAWVGHPWVAWGPLRFTWCCQCPRVLQALRVPPLAQLGLFELKRKANYNKEAKADVKDCSLLEPSFDQAANPTLQLKDLRG